MMDGKSTKDFEIGLALGAYSALKLILQEGWTDVKYLQHLEGHYLAQLEALSGDPAEDIDGRVNIVIEAAKRAADAR